MLKTYKALIIVFCIFNFFQNGCISFNTLTLKVNLNKAQEHPSSGRFLAGAAKADITPVPGYPMGGYAVSARTSRGWWTRLYSRAIYIEDSSGTPLFLVSCDLWSMPAGLTDVVTQNVQKKLPFVGRQNIIISATHTHQSPGNYSTSEFYNSFGSQKKGFDRELFHFLARRIAESMLDAYKNRQESLMKVYTTKVYNVTRNRSYPAFLYNPECWDIINSNKDIPLGETSPLYPDSLAFRAVIPELKIIRFDPAEAKKGSTAPIALAAFFAVHPNSLGSMPEIYNGGIFGVVTTMLEQHFAEVVSSDKNYLYKEKSVVAFFNGAEGDVSPVWKKQDRQTTMKLGRILADSVLNIMKKASYVLPDNPISVRYKRICIADTFFIDDSGRKYYTDKQAVPGDPLLGGAEDGRSFAYYLGFVEGVKGERTTLQGSKKKVFDNPLYPDIIAGLVEGLIRNTLVKNAPRYVPVGLCRLKGITICAVPGEFTTTLGYRLEQALSENREQNYPPHKIFLIGLANEYLSYFTTPEEYEAQHYEGASTLYGPASGPFIINAVKNISSLPDGKSGQFSGEYSYFCGECESFGMKEIEASPVMLDDGFENIAQDEDGNPKRSFPKCTWSDKVLDWDNAKEGFLPDIKIEVKKINDKDWSPLILNEAGDIASSDDSIKIPETDRGLDFIIFSNYDKDKDQIKWHSIWMAPGQLYKSKNINDFDFRFSIRRGEKTFASSGFRLNDKKIVEAREIRLLVNK